jgi:hypothetical protein
MPSGSAFASAAAAKKNGSKLKSRAKWKIFTKIIKWPVGNPGWQNKQTNNECYFV